MKLKIYLLSLLSILAVFLAAQYLFVNLINTHLTLTLKDSVSRATSLYKYINKADTLEKIKKSEQLAEKKELLEAFDTEQYKTTPQDVASKVQIELNIINKFSDSSDVIFVTDTEGAVVAKNLDDTLKGVNFKENLLIKNALLGRADENIFKMLKQNKYFKVTSVPIRKDGKIIGAFSSANYIDSKIAKEDFSKLYEETNEETRQTPLYLAFIEPKNLLGSNMPPELHEAFKRYVETNSEMIDMSFKDQDKRHSFEVVLNGERFFANIAIHPQLDNQEKVCYIILSSIDKTLEPVKNNRNNYMLLTAIIILISFIFGFIIEESFHAPINKFMEGMIEIINGNKGFRFNNEATGLEGNLNQNANYMISVLLGEKTPEEKNVKKEMKIEE